MNKIEGFIVGHPWHFVVANNADGKAGDTLRLGNVFLTPEAAINFVHHLPADAKCWPVSISVGEPLNLDGFIPNDSTEKEIH